MLNLVVLDQTVGAYLTEILRKNLTFTSHLSKSLMVIGTGTDWSATYHFLLVFRSNYGPISYRFRDKGQYLQKFPTPRM